MPRVLEIITIGRFKRKHVECYSSTTKNVIYLLPWCSWSPNLAGRWLTMKGFPPIKSHDPLITWSLRDKLKAFIIESYGPLIRCSFKITWQTLPQLVWPPKLPGWWLTIRGSYWYSFMALWSRNLARSLIFPLQQCLWPTNLSGFSLTLIVTWPFDHVVWEDHVKN